MRVPLRSPSAKMLDMKPCEFRQLVRCDAFASIGITVREVL